jgi:hypothetical protein
MILSTIIHNLKGNKKMFNKKTYLAITISTLSSFTAFADRVEAHVEFQVGNKAGKKIIIIDSEEYIHLTMDNENLGFLLKLTESKEGNERFETTPTYNGEPIANFFQTGKQTRLGAGCTLNGHKIEKELIITFLEVKKLP